MSTEEVVKVENLWAYYDGEPVLEDVNLSIGRNDFLGVIGPNGGGKTTLLKVILGLVKPKRGIVSVLGKSPEKSRNKIGYVPQINLFDHDFPIFNILALVDKPTVNLYFLHSAIILPNFGSSKDSP